MNSIKIDIIDNGYILSYVKTSSLGQAPELVVEYYNNLDDVFTTLSRQYK